MSGRAETEARRRNASYEQRIAELIEQKRSAEARAEQQYHVYKAELASLRERTAAELGELARRQAVVEGEAPRLAAAVAAAKAELVDMRISDARYAEIKTIPPAK